jgi:hypothetical protein
MAVYKIFPTKDATIYSKFPARNTGLDSIIETSTDKDAHLSRYLIQFSQEEINTLVDNTISSSYASGSGFGDIKVNLKNFIANISNLNTDTTLEVFPVSGSWNMGTGRFNDVPETDNGCSWVFRSFSGSNAWRTSGFATNSTGSFGDTPGGGNWYHQSALGFNIVQSQSYNYTSNKDLGVNVTGTFKTWYSQSKGLTSNGFSNDGFIVKQSIEDEAGGLYKNAEIKFYSIDSNTIYPPELEFQWKDHSFVTASSSIPIIQNSELVASLDNNPGEFRRDSVHKFKINCRSRFPSRVYQTSSIYLNQHYLPQSSSYAVKDLDTNEFVIDFDNDYTRISADGTGSFFNLYMKGLEPERYYQILLKVPIENQILILDDNYYFKVVNG